MRRAIVWLASVGVLAGVALLAVAQFGSRSVPQDDPAGRTQAADMLSGPVNASSESLTGPSMAEGSSPLTTASCDGWACDQVAQFSSALAMISHTTGHVGVVVRDRVTGAVWRAGEPDYRIWAGSTPKLAFAVALREQARAGQITLDDVAEHEIAAMLSVSDNKAADALWNRYANAASLMTRLHDTYGMTNAGYVNGFPSRWGFVKCTAQDLANLMAYILSTLNPADRGPMITAMRTVGDVQHWGVWGAGPSLRPGVKNGWSIESDDGHDHWITATVGFAGPDERYIVAAMYHQPPGGDSVEKGVHLLTDLVATIFGAPVPAPVTIPEDY